MVLVCLYVSVACAQPAGDAPATKSARAVIVASTTNASAAARVAERAAALLGLSLGVEGQRWGATLAAVGSAVQVHERRPGAFGVFVYVGDQSGADASLARARLHYPVARQVSVTVTTDEQYADPSYRFGVLVVGTYTRHADALAAAQEYAAKSGQPLSTRGLVYDERDGLVWPKDADDRWAGSYAPRRYDDCDFRAPGPCVSVERSDGYPGFQPGHYIVVAGVVSLDGREASRLTQARAIVPSAFIRATTLYLGCMH